MGYSLQPQNFQFGQPQVQSLVQPQIGYGSPSQYGTTNLAPVDYSLMAGQPVNSGLGLQFPGVGSGAATATGGGGIGGQLGFNMPTMNLALSGAQTLMGLYSGYQANKLAKEQFNFTKQYAEKNLANQTAAYNDHVETRENQRAVMQGRSREETDAEIARRRLTA